MSYPGMPCMGMAPWPFCQVPPTPELVAQVAAAQAQHSGPFAAAAAAAAAVTMPRFPMEGAAAWLPQQGPSGGTSPSGDSGFPAAGGRKGGGSSPGGNGGASAAGWRKNGSSAPRPQRPPAGPAPAPAVESPKAVGSPGMGADGEIRSSHNRSSRRLRLWAHIYLHMQVPGFDLVPRLIGRGGCNMRRIAESTGAKIRIRGRGSGHLEIDGKSEAPTPLMVAVTTDCADGTGFRQAIEMTLAELRTVEQRFLTHCQKMAHVHEGPCFSMGLLPDAGRECLGDLLEGVAHSGLAKQQGMN